MWPVSKRGLVIAAIAAFTPADLLQLDASTGSLKQVRFLWARRRQLNLLKGKHLYNGTEILLNSRNTLLFTRMSSENIASVFMTREAFKS